MWSLEDFKIGTGPSNVPINQDVKPVYFLCKQKIDQYVAKTRMEAFRLKRLKSDNLEKARVDQIELDVAYVPYFILEGTHEIKHLRKNTIQIPLKEDVIAMNIGETILNKTDLKQSKDGMYETNVMELVSHVNSDRLIFNEVGKPMKEKDIPDYQPMEESLKEEILDKQQIKAEINENLLLENFKTSILKPSQNNIKTIEENLNVMLKIILRAYFIGKIKIKDKTKIMSLDSVTGESKIE